MNTLINNKILFLLVLFVIFLFVVNIAMAIEEAKYTTIDKEGIFELRQYESQIVAETFVEGDFEKVGKEGFRRLYDYISGKNQKKAVHINDGAGRTRGEFAENFNDFPRQSAAKW
jgi:hypothetical protein